MAFLIGQCVSNPVPPTGGSSGSGGSGGGTTVIQGSALNETVGFTSVATFNLPWNAARKAKFGTHANLNVYMIGPDGQYRLTWPEIKPDNIAAPSSYHFDFGDVVSGVIIIS